MPLISHNPATEETLATFEELTDPQIEERLASAHRTFGVWRNASLDERVGHIRSLARELRENTRFYAELVTKEMGRPILASIAEIEKCASVCDYYADQAPAFLAHERVVTEHKESFVRFDPIGVVLAIMPWNFPFWQVIRFAVPALIAGNSVMLKHASNVPQCGMALEELFRKAGLPPGAFQNLMISSAQVAWVLQDKRVKAVTLTGSEKAGGDVASIAGKEIKPSVLELGGSDPFIVLEDADIEKAATIGVSARLLNCGQSCISAKRFVLVRSIAEEFIRLFKEKMQNIIIGDPMDEKTEMGPLSSKKSLQDIQLQVEHSVIRGATCLIGGKKREGKGYYYEPTILLNVQKGMPAYDEELFGPVAPMIIVENTDEAIRIANDTPYGLGASLWTNNRELAKELIPMIDAGCVFVNGMVRSDPRMPFGGVKKSGYGRELAQYGIREFVNIKTVVIN